MEVVWLDALHHSISSSSWLDAARAWVDANCAAFEPDPSEFSCGQFQLFAEFRELADSLIGRVLDELGCNSPSAEDALVDALEERGQDWAVARAVLMMGGGLEMVSGERGRYQPILT